jgi:hypothetical protein
LRRFIGPSQDGKGRGIAKAGDFVRVKFPGSFIVFHSEFVKVVPG